LARDELGFMRDDAARCFFASGRASPAGILFSCRFFLRSGFLFGVSRFFFFGFNRGFFAG